MSHFFYIRDVRIDPKINTITREGKSVKIEPKIMNVLMCLVEAKGDVVSKQHLFEIVWAETVVVEMVLTRAISELRRVFGDKPTDPKFIDTISKSGYRLIAPVSKKRPERRSRRSLRLTLPVAAALTLIVVLFGFLQSDPQPPLSSVPLTFEKGWEFHPSLSPNGGWVAYVSSEANKNVSDIYLKSISDDSLVQLTDSDGYFLKPVWSPDEKSIAAFGIKDGLRGIYIFSVGDQASKKTIAIKTQYVGLAWSPDGEEISYVAYDSATSRHSVYKYSVKDDTSVIQVTSALDTWGDSNPRYSPDGKSLAFVRTVSEGNQDIYNLDLSTLALSRLTQLNRNIFGFDWEDASTLLISSNLDGGENLWKVNVKDKNNPAEMKRILKIPYGESIQNPTVHDGLIVGEKWMKDIDLVISDLYGRPLADSMILTSTQWELHPDISKNGEEVVFSSNRSGSYEIWKYNFEDRSLHQLTKLEEGFSGKPKWSPDGKWIVFESNAIGSHQIYVMEADGSNLRLVTDGQGDYINPSWSRDGSFVYCSSNIDGNWSIWAQSLSNGRLRKINSDSYFLQEANSLESAFITKLHRNGIWEMKLDGTEEKIIEDLNSGDWGSWMVGQDGIYYFSDKENQVRFYDFETKSISNILRLPKSIPGNDPAFTVWDEGGLVIYGQLKSYGGDLIAIRNY